MIGLSEKLKKHLDKANFRYIQISNINEIIASKYSDFSLQNHVDRKVNRILNIGIGNGLELVALYRIYKKERAEIIGVDVSPISIKLARDLLIKNKIDPLRVKLVVCNATKLPFPDEYIDIVFMNSLLHEVFSYSPNGKKDWESAIKEACRVLAPGGLLYIEDFAAPNEAGYVKIILKSELARNFYEYFRNEYRSFKSWGKIHAKLFSKDRKLIAKNMPILKTPENSILLGSALALELLTHFKIFANDLNSKLTFLGDKEWIEINERYYPSADGIKDLTGIDRYIQKVLNVVNKDLNSGRQLNCLEFYVTERANFLKDIRKHFSAYTEKRKDFIPFSSKKMKILFKKGN